ncbi:hypothetical protein D1AOALGA4SA_9768 [Olavius algarvensis Delta 1 endosymbiont]|nr:hypothetical protein D1AOALGA4SA_9768 [Olavius algarvensis Delta 1 endosymbiont]
MNKILKSHHDENRFLFQTHKPHSSNPASSICKPLINRQHSIAECRGPNAEYRLFQSAIRIPKSAITYCSSSSSRSVKKRKKNVMPISAATIKI